MTTNIANKAQDLLNPPKNTGKLIVTPAPTTGQGLALSSSSLIPNGAVTYQAFVPVWTGSISAPVLGNAETSNIMYTHVGRLVHYYGRIVFGSTSTYGTGNYTFSLPVQASAHADYVGSGFLSHNAGGFGPGVARLTSTTAFTMYFGATYLGTVTQIATTQPWTWATSDSIGWDLVYQSS